MQTAPVVFDAVAFLTFLAAKPPAERYNFNDNCNCPIAQYLQTQTRTRVSCGNTVGHTFDQRTADIHTFDIPAGWSDAIAGTNGSSFDEEIRAKWTFGQAAERFKALASAA